MVVLTDKEKKRLAEKHTKLLAELVKKPENSTCADCGAQGPRWASWNLGVFLCIRCGGFHRRIGTHITKVKSISLDNWTPEQIEHFRRIGNQRANAFFNPHPERHPAPRSDREIERYIRDKYERRAFVDTRNGVPDPTQENADYSPEAPGSANAAVDEATALTRLREMGFANVRENHAALQKFKFDINAAAAYLSGDAAPAKPKISINDPRVKQLLNMGFDHAGQNVQALIQCGGDVNQAIELLLSDNPPPRTTSGTAKTPATAAPAPAPAPVPAAPPKPASAAAAADLLDADFFGSAPSSSSAAHAPAVPAKSQAAAAAATGSLDDMFGSLSLSTPAQPPAPAQAPAPAPAQPTTDLFGDFSSFLSAAPATSSSTAAAQAAQPTVTAAPAPAPAQASHGGQTMFDNDFIMSLYSKAPPAQQQQRSTAAAAQGFQTSASTGQKGSSNAFNDLDFFM